MFPDGNIQDGDTLSPTDIEANLSTEVSLTVLDVLELFVHHHKVCASFISCSYTFVRVIDSVLFREIYFSLCYLLLCMIYCMLLTFEYYNIFYEYNYVQFCNMGIKCKCNKTYISMYGFRNSLLKSNNTVTYWLWSFLKSYLNHIFVFAP